MFAVYVYGQPIGHKIELVTQNLMTSPKTAVQQKIDINDLSSYHVIISTKHDCYMSHQLKNIPRMLLTFPLSTQYICAAYKCPKESFLPFIGDSNDLLGSTLSKIKNLLVSKKLLLTPKKVSLSCCFMMFHRIWSLEAAIWQRFAAQSHWHKSQEKPPQLIITIQKLFPNSASLSSERCKTGPKLL